MVKVECEGCKAPYEIDERRIPASGLKMRCPKCGTSVLVQKPGGAAPPPGPPAPALRKPPPPAAAPPPPAAAPAPAAGGFGSLDPFGDGDDNNVDLPAMPEPDAVDLPAARPAPPSPFRAPPAAPPPVAAAAPPPRPLGGFGEIDLMVEGGAGEVDLPSAAPAAPAFSFGHAPQPGAIDLPAARQAPPRPPAGPPGFGEPSIDVDQGFGAIDLPAARPAPPPRGGGFAAPSVEAQEFGAVDLPIVSGADQQPRFGARVPPPPPQRGGPPPQHAGLPAAFHGAGAAGLPNPVAASYGGLPSPLGQAGLPAPHHAGLPAALGDAGLPAHATVQPGLPIRSQGNLPSPAGAGLPAMGGPAAGLPMTASHLPSPMGHGLPMVGGSLPAVGGNLPLVGGSLPAVGGSLPAVGGSLPAVGGSLPTVGGSLPTVGGSLPTVGGSLPVVGGGLPVAGGSLPTVGGSLPTVGAGFPAMAPGGLPVLGGNLPSHSSSGMPAVQSAGYPSVPPQFGAEEANFGSPGQFGPVGEAAAGGIDVGSVNLGGPSGGIAGVGGEVELDGGPPGAAGVPIAIAPAPRTRGTTARSDDAPKKPSNAGKYAIGVLTALTIGGALMGFSPKLGPFGSHLISDTLNASKYDDALSKFRAEAQDTLDADTVTSSMNAIQRARQLHDDAVRHENTSAYAAFLGYMKSVRYGKDAGTEAAAKGFLDGTDPSKNGLDQMLAKSAQAAVAGELDQARNLAASALGAKPDDTDALCLSGEIELQAKAGPAALDMFTKAVAAHKSARTLFGLARAQRLVGKGADATATAKSVLESNPNHVGALVMLASIASEGSGDAAAIESLKKVVDDPNVRKEASDRELVQAYSALGRLHLAASHLSLAEDAFNQALKLEPQDLDSLLGSGELYYRVGRYSEGQARFDGALRTDPSNLDAKIGLDKTLLSLERVADAQKDLVALSSANPKDARVYYWLGRANEILDDKKGAANAYKKSIENAGKAETGVPAYVAYSHLLASESQNEEAAKLLNEAATKYPNSADLSKARGEIALATGRYEEAREMFEDALKKNDDIDTHFKLGQTLRRMKKFVEAKAEYDKVAAVDKDYPSLPLERGLYYEETGESAQALAEYDAALKKAPNDIDLKLRIGSTQVIAGHAKQAEPMLKEVLKERPNSAEANHFLGRAMLLAKDSIADAQRYLEKAAELDPKRAEYHLYVGWAANDAGQPEKATEALEKAIKLDGTLADAYWQLGILEHASQQCDKSIQSLLTALKLRPSRYEAYYTLGLCLSVIGEWDKAEDSFKRAISFDDKNPDYHYRLLLVYERNNDRAGIIKEGEAALDLVSGYSTVPGWVGKVERVVGEAYWPSDKKKAIEHFKVYLKVTTPDDAYYKDIQRQVESGG